MIRTADRDGLKRHLDGQGIGNEIYYPVPFHLQPCFANLGYRQGAFPHAERAALESLAIPVYGELTADQQETVVSADRPVRAAPRAGERRTMKRPGPSVSNTTQILIGLALGIAVGYLFPSSDAGGVHVAGFAEQIKPLADVFLRMIKMIIAPLLFSTLVVGIAGTGDMKTMGRIGLKAIIYFEVATTIALFLGLALVNIFKPGAGMSLPLGADTKVAAAMVQNQQHAWDILLHMFPTSVIDSMARGDILQVVIFSMFFGIALAAIGAKGKPVLDVLESTAQAMFKFTGYVMAFAPVGVFAAIAATVGSKGLGILLTLGKLVGLMYLGLVIFALIVLGTRLVPDPRAVSHLRQGDPRADADRVHDRQLGGRAAQVARDHGALRRPQEHRRLRAADRLQLQPGRLDAVSVAVQRVRGPDGRRADDPRPAAGHDADADAHQQRRGRRAARRAGGARRDARAPSTCRSKAPRSCSRIDQIMDMGRTAVNVMGNCIATAVVARWEGVFDDDRMRAFAAGAESRAA